MDRLMYRYHYGKLKIERLADFLGIITDNQIDEELAGASLNIFIIRCLIELKRTKQDFYVITKDKTLMKDKEIVEELKKRFERHKNLISLLQSQAFQRVHDLSEEFPEDSKVNPKDLSELLNHYYCDLLELDRQIRYNS